MSQLIFQYFISRLTIDPVALCFDFLGNDVDPELLDELAHTAVDQGLFKMPRCMKKEDFHRLVYDFVTSQGRELAVVFSLTQVDPKLHVSPFTEECLLRLADRFHEFSKSKCLHYDLPQTLLSVFQSHLKLDQEPIPQNAGGLNPRIKSYFRQAPPTTSTHDHLTTLTTAHIADAFGTAHVHEAFAMFADLEESKYEPYFERVYCDVFLKSTLSMSQGFRLELFNAVEKFAIVYGADSFYFFTPTTHSAIPAWSARVVDAVDLSNFTGKVYLELNNRDVLAIDVHDLEIRYKTIACFDLSKTISLRIFSLSPRDGHAEDLVATEGSPICSYTEYLHRKSDFEIRLMHSRLLFEANQPSFLIPENIIAELRTMFFAQPACAVVQEFAKLLKNDKMLPALLIEYPLISTNLHAALQSCGDTISLTPGAVCRFLDELEPILVFLDLVGNENANFSPVNFINPFLFRVISSSATWGSLFSRGVSLEDFLFIQYKIENFRAPASPVLLSELLKNVQDAIKIATRQRQF